MLAFCKWKMFLGPLTRPGQDARPFLATGFPTHWCRTRCWGANVFPLKSQLLKHPWVTQMAGQPARWDLWRYLGQFFEQGICLHVVPFHAAALADVLVWQVLDVLYLLFDVFFFNLLFNEYELSCRPAQALLRFSAVSLQWSRLEGIRSIDRWS